MRAQIMGGEKAGVQIDVEMVDAHIFKYTLDLNRRVQHVKIAASSRILSVQMQYGMCQVWALVDTSTPHVSRRFEVYPTGIRIERTRDLVFIGTVQVDNGSLVFHVFMRNP